jgi:molybdenum ABC transporter molybdate-binding protein
VNDAIEELGPLDGKILVDCTNPLKEDFSGLAIGHDTSAGEQVSAWAKGAKVVKAFNMTGAPNMSPHAKFPVKPVMFVCGNDAVAKKSVITRTRYTLLGNDLVLIAPRSAAAKAVTLDPQTDWKALLHGERLAVGDPNHVPAGIYAKEALQKLGAWDGVAPALAPANNVRAALALVERNETPYGIVYGSDAVASDKVQVVGRFPADSHKPVEYPMAIVNDHDTAAVKAFYDYLKGPQAAAIFKHYGFTPTK